jgi:hypothetical protein
LAFSCLALQATGLLRAVLRGQSARDQKAAFSKLKSTLSGLKDAGANRSSLASQLVDEMMILADANRPPSRSSVVVFADELTGVLLGKSITNGQLDVLRQSIGEALSGSTANYLSAGHFRETLTAVGIDSSRKRLVTNLLIAIAEEVRGPDDSPVLPIKLLK